jgi:hypothetical protein
MKTPKIACEFPLNLKYPWNCLKIEDFVFEAGKYDLKINDLKEKILKIK